MVLRTNFKHALKTAMVALGCFYCIILLSGFSSVEQEKAYHWYQNARYFFKVRTEPLKAYQCLEKALELDPENLKIRLLMDEVSKNLQMDRTPTPVEKEDAVRWTQKGLYLKRSDAVDDLKSAANCFEKALLFNPSLEKARELLQEVREQLKFSLEDEVLANQAEERFQEGEQKLAESDWSAAAELFGEAARLDKRNLPAHLKLLMLARRSGDTGKEKAELKLVIKIMRFTRVSEKQKERVSEALSCLSDQNHLQAIMEEQGYLVGTRKSSWDDVIERFYDPLPEAIATARQGLNQIPTGLDIPKFVEDGLLLTAPECTSGGKYFLTGDGVVWCTVHGLKPLPEGTLTVEEARKAHLAGRHFLELGRPEDARKQLEKALQLLAGDGEVINDLGVALLRLGKTTEAMSQFDEAVKIAPDLPVVYVNRSAARQSIGQLDEAAADLEKAYQLGEDTVELHYSLAYLEMQRGNIKKSLIEYLKVDDLLPAGDPRKERVTQLIVKLRNLK